MRVFKVRNKKTGKIEHLTPTTMIILIQRGEQENYELLKVEEI